MVSKAERRKRSQARRDAARTTGSAIRGKYGAGYLRQPRKPAWYRKVLAGFLILLAGVAALGGLVMYFPQRAEASQYLAATRCPAGPAQAQPDCVRWVVGRVADNRMYKNVDTLSPRDLSALTFTSPDSRITALRAGDQVQIAIWRGALQAVSIDGQVYYADDSAVQRPMGDLGIAMLGAVGCCLTVLLKGVPLLRRRGAGQQLISVTRWTFGAMGTVLLFEALGTLLMNSLWGGPPFFAAFAALVLVLVGALTPVLLGVSWVVGKARRLKTRGTGRPDRS